jgi:hypothetical protein
VAVVVVAVVVEVAVAAAAVVVVVVTVKERVSCDVFQKCSIAPSNDIWNFNTLYYARAC